ncbi:helix-turn-helix domain-containing protein [uncultured Nocardioides sp.]|uniref:helix-turn-helix domain-containing protein n=1 Tax=Nocardioides sp. T5 TaxID=3400182 RepID=UPI0026035629|nr:helix-turn-helix domain-containing protein [uncultured Nocardioides sp.]
MPTPADHLRDLVERAVRDDAGDTADTTDTTDTTAQRLRRAMAGESPARFVDRLVLERAAHLVATTDRTLHDIATEAGFRGYDVFARAFRRELGALPSQWRADPTSHLIDAPGDAHVHPPDGLRLPARWRMDSVDLVVDMAGRHVRIVTGLVDAAGQVPDPELDRPVDGATLRSALTSAVADLAALTALVRETGVDDPADDEPLASLREQVARVGPDFVDAVALLGATGRFDEAFVDAFRPEPTATSFGTMVARTLTDADGTLLLARARLRACGVEWQVPA